MIAFMRGTLVEVNEDHVIVDVGGVGYQVTVPPICMDSLRNLGEGAETTLVTYHYHMVEQSRAIPVLFGFRTSEERDFFTSLLAVIGPRVALKAMAAPIGEIAQSVELGDSQYLKSLPGIGAQKAKELVAKLQGKLTRFVGVSVEPIVAEAQAGRGDFVSDALDALVSLDFKRAEAVQMVNRALRRDSSISTVEELLREAYAQD